MGKARNSVHQDRIRTWVRVGLGAGVVSLVTASMLPLAALEDNQDGGFVVDVSVGGGTGEYDFASEVTEERVTQDYDTTRGDSFSVDGVTATVGSWEAEITVGDRIVVTALDSGEFDHALENREPTDGFVGNILTTDAGGFANTYQVIEPITGTPMSGFIDYVDTCDVYRVDGLATGLGGFEDSISEGDELVRTNDGSEICSLVNHTVAGTVQDLTTDAGPPPAATLRIGNLGDSFDDGAQSQGALPAVDFTYLVDGGYEQDYFVHGALATLQEFVDEVSDGALASYERSGGTECFALLSALPATDTGVVTENTAAPVVEIRTDGGNVITYNYSGDDAPRFDVDGVRVSRSAFEGDLTPGDELSITRQDSAACQPAVLDLTNGPPPEPDPEPPPPVDLDCDRFVDVDDDNTFHRDICWIAGESITLGCNPPANDRYCPKDGVLRQQMASFLTRGLDLTDTSPGGDFVDVTDDNVHRTDINRLSTARITLGCNPPTNNRFCPSDTVSRQQMASFIVRALDLSDASDADRFIDVADDNTHRLDIARLANAGITFGCSPPANDRFCPSDTVSREQMAAFLHRALRD